MAIFEIGLRLPELSTLKIKSLAQLLINLQGIQGCQNRGGKGSSCHPII